MSTVFTQQLRVRRYECDFIGHVNNGVYVQYLEQATEDAFAHWDFDTPPDAWDIRELTVEYLAPAVPLDELEMHVWLKAKTEDTLTLCYELKRPKDRTTILQAELIWHCRARLELREKGRHLRSVDRSAVKPFTPPTEADARPFTWKHAVRQYELNSKRQVSASTYFNWFHHTVLRAADLKGWTRDKWMCEDLFAVQRRHHAEFFVPATDQDELEIWGRMLEFKRVRGTFVNEVRNTRTGTLHMRDYIESVIVDRQGRPRIPPPGFVEAFADGE